MLLRFGHEMNGDWYGWGGARNGASLAAASQFVATWRYVRDRFTRAGATNVTGGIVPGFGHWIMEENPTATIRLVSEFLKRR